MITMVSTIARGGVYVEPRIVKATIDSQTKERTEVEVVTKERVISEETAKNVLSMMESVVAEGTGKNSQVKGYRIGGKTGTSEDGVNTGKYVTSFIGVAPISDPSVAVLITLYNPTGEGGHQGGGVAAPIGAQIFGEVLPYLEVIKDAETQEEQVNEIEVPNIEGKTLKEAESILKENNLKMVLTDEQISQENSQEGEQANENNLQQKESVDKENTVVKEQTPKASVKVKEGSNVYVDW